MRSFLSLIVLGTVSLASISDPVLILSFAVNRSYIAKNLCEKRDDPGNTCQGCCLLKKELANEDRKENSPPAKSLREFEDFQPVPVSTAVVIVPPRTCEIVLDYHMFSLPLPLDTVIDHPPEASFV